MKLQVFKTIAYLICIFLFAFSMLYLMWTGATYLFIGGENIKPNGVDIVALALLACYMTRDFFYNFRLRRCKK